MAKRGAREKFDYAAQWDETDEREITLPSGKRVVVGSPDLPTMAKQGHIPNHLLPIVERYLLEQGALQGDAKKINERDDDSPDAAQRALERLRAVADFNGYMAIFCVAAVVEPRLSLDGREGTLNVARLSTNDQSFIWQVVEGYVKPLAEFPGDGAGPVEPVAALPGGGEVRDDAQPDAGAD